MNDIIKNFLELNAEVILDSLTIDAPLKSIVIVLVSDIDVKLAVILGVRSLIFAFTIKSLLNLFVLIIYEPKKEPGCYFYVALKDK